MLHWFNVVAALLACTFCADTRTALLFLVCSAAGNLVVDAILLGVTVGLDAVTGPGAGGFTGLQAVLLVPDVLYLALFGVISTRLSPYAYLAVYYILPLRRRLELSSVLTAEYRPAYTQQGFSTAFAPFKASAASSSSSSSSSSSLSSSS